MQPKFAFVYKLTVCITICLAPFSTVAQDFMMQGWYWDYPKTTSGFNWADTVRLRAQDLANNGFTHVWLPPFFRASFGNSSNGYDPKDLFDLGEYGGGATGFGTRTDLNNLIAEFNARGLKAVADMVYNHRDGGKAENNPSVAGWIRNMTWAKIAAGDQPFPSDRFRLILPIGGATGRGAGTYWFKFGSKSQHSNFFNKPYKVYMQTRKVGFQNLPAQNESEPNGGGGCSPPQANNAIQLGRDMNANIDASGCKIDEFALTLSASDFNASDTIFIYLNNRNVGGLGDYSDHTVLELYYSGGGGNIESAIFYQTFTDFTTLASGRGDMSHPNFKPNGNATQLAGDLDAMYFFYDYDQKNVASTIDTLHEWTRWLWNSVGIRGFRMDAVKHFDPVFTGDLLDFLHNNGIDPGLVVGEFFDGNPAVLKGWIDNVKSSMNAGTQAAIYPRVFDFALREALEKSSDQFGYDARNVFNASVVDAQGGSGFNYVTFVNNHDFRDAGQPVDNDPILAYAYILTNNQVGLPSVFYYDYFNLFLRTPINKLINAHRNYIYGMSERDYLSRFSTPYSANYISAGAGAAANTSLLYQLSGLASGRDVVAGINYAGATLKVDHEVNTTTMDLAIGDTLVDYLGRSNFAYAVVNASRQIYMEIPSRNYSVWVEGNPHLRLSDATVTEGNSGTVTATFTVSLEMPMGHTVTVQYATANNSATAGSDYVAIPLTTLTFNPLETSKTISVTVNGDTGFESDETFFVNLSNPTNAVIIDGQGSGTIQNDDCISTPTANAGADLATATGVLAKLGANPTASGVSPFTYSWSPATGLSSTTVANPTATPTSTTTYTLTVTDANGCVATDQVNVRAGNLVNSSIQRVIGPTNIYDPVLNQVRADIAIKNISGTPIYGPVTAVFKTLSPGPPTITIPNADGGGSGIGCYYDYSNLLGPDNVLSPGETTGFKLWIFQENVLPAVNFKFFANVTGDLDGVPKSAGDNAPLTLTFDLQKGALQDGTDSKLASDAVEIPTRYALHPNHPNPFNPSTTMQFDLPAAGKVRLQIYNSVGQLVRTLVDGDYAAGGHKVIWDARNDNGVEVASGVYLAVFKAGEAKLVRRVTLMR